MINLELLTSPRLRLGVILSVICLFYCIIIIQLWNMQVIRQEEYQDRTRRQSLRTIRIPPIRGRILARNGEILATNRVSYNAKLHLAELRGKTIKETIHIIQATISETAARIGRDHKITEEKIRRHMNYYTGIPMELFRDLTTKELAALRETHPLIEGLEITAEPIRSYPQGIMAAHLLGYVSPGDPNKASDRSNFFYYIPDAKGKTGLELKYDDKLRGTPGRQLAMVNSAGYVHEYLQTESAVNGQTLRLTLDFQAQLCAEQLLQDKTGSIVLLNANNGEILAMASSPAYSPEAFIPKISARDYRLLANNPARPFVNRSTTGTYMPGSIIKPLTALAAIENGMDPDQNFECDGSVPYGYSKSIKCMFNAVHGHISFIEALKRSCNGYFVDAGVHCGIEALSKLFASAGIGSRTGFELPERKGILPKPSDRWTESETAYVSFGQGKIEITPLQAAVYTAAIANGGTRWKPILVKSILDTSGKHSEPVTVYDAMPEKRGTLAASQQALSLVREGMYQVVHGNGGSGRLARNPAVSLSGKTGTADIVTKQGKSKNTWFIGFGTDPENGVLYAIAIVIEGGESGGKTAAPIAGEFFKNYIAARKK
ncbi:MAG: penicillin-binding protein 2 [Lentisphaeria bacterium]|nr:penicillin-binding protein 2 [Lentisphaeria bacterium]